MYRMRCKLKLADMLINLNDRSVYKLPTIFTTPLACWKLDIENSIVSPSFKASPERDTLRYMEEDKSIYFFRE